MKILAVECPLDYFSSSPDLLALFNVQGEVLEYVYTTDDMRMGKYLPWIEYYHYILCADGYVVRSSCCNPVILVNLCRRRRPPST